MKKKKLDDYEQTKINAKFMTTAYACSQSSGKEANIDEVKHYVELGANVNCFNIFGYTAADLVLKSEEPIKKNLLEYFLSVKEFNVNNRYNEKYPTPLERAVEIEDAKDAFEICKKLVEKGAKIYSEKDNIDAIKIAKECAEPNQELIDFLIKCASEKIIDSTEDRTEDMSMQIYVEELGKNMKDANLMEDL